MSFTDALGNPLVPATLEFEAIALGASSRSFVFGAFNDVKAGAAER